MTLSERPSSRTARSAVLTENAALLLAQGKDIDFIGSICLIVVIGLSIDYSVHLCHAYMESQAASRAERSRDAVTRMGVSVVSGAITTFGAAVFLCACSMTFFYDFGASDEHEHARISPSCE